MWFLDNTDDNQHGCTDVSMSRGHLDICKHLMENKADVNAAMTMRQGKMLVACQKGHSVRTHPGNEKFRCFLKFPQKSSNNAPKSKQQARLNKSLKQDDQ